MKNSLYLGKLFFILGIVSFGSHACKVQTSTLSASTISQYKSDSIYELTVLGVAQDAGYPQANCIKDCCKKVWADQGSRRMVSCIGLKDRVSGQMWMIDATPDFKDQLHLLKNPFNSQAQDQNKEARLAGIFLTHAHIGHYTGLIHLGREVMGAEAIPVFAMPRMTSFLKDNGPWSQLVSLENIRIETMEASKEISLSKELSITPLLVPHRDEFSETVGYVIKSKAKSVLYIPDIDKWEKWDLDINAMIEQVDYAFLDASFYQNGEIWGRDMSEIPHPFVVESMTKFATLSMDNRAKIHFIHLNHTNPLLDPQSDAQKEVEEAGYKLAKEGQLIKL